MTTGADRILLDASTWGACLSREADLEKGARRNHGWLRSRAGGRACSASSIVSVCFNVTCVAEQRHANQRRGGGGKKAMSFPLVRRTGHYSPERAMIRPNAPRASNQRS